MIINETFFHGVIKIDGIFLGVGTPEATTSATIGMLSSYIEQFEPEYLIELFGGEMARLFMDYVYNEAEDKVAVERWDNLKDQLVFGLSARPISPIAEYVYYYYVNGRQKSATSEGVTIQQNKPSNPTQECVSAWNRMVKANERIGIWIQENKSTYPEWRKDENVFRYINLLGI